MNSKKHWEKPQLVTHDTVVALTSAGQDKCGSVVDSTTQSTGLDGVIVPDPGCKLT